MSPLPEKKKTPEELAALRESLGISSEGPPSGVPGLMPKSAPPPQVEEPTPLPEKNPAPAEVRAEPGPEENADEELFKVAKADEPIVLASEELQAPEAKPVMSLRKSERLPVDQPKRRVTKESGKLPTRRQSDAERIPLEKVSAPARESASSLPSRKHSDDELARLRHQPQPGVTPPAVHLANQTAGLVSLLAIYALGAVLMFLSILGAISARVPRFDLPFEWLSSAVALPNYSMIVFGILAAGGAVMLLGALWIYFKKPRSQHHCAILTIIAVLVLVFGTLYFFPGLHGA